MSKPLKKSKGSNIKTKSSTYHKSSQNQGRNSLFGDNAVIGHFDMVETFKYTMSSLDYTIFTLPKDDDTTLPLNFISQPGVCSTFKSTDETSAGAKIRQNNDNSFLQRVKDENLDANIQPDDQNTPQQYVDLFNE